MELLFGTCSECGKQVKGYRNKHEVRVGRHNCKPLHGWTPIDDTGNPRGKTLVDPRPREAGKHPHNRAYEVPLKAFGDDELQLLFELVEAEMVRRAER